MSSFTVKQKSVDLFGRRLKEGWNRLGDRTGVHLFSDGTKRWSNCGGTIFYDQVVIKEQIWQPKTVIGNGMGECIGPRGSRRFRRQPPSGLFAPVFLPYGDRIPFAKGLEHGMSINFTPIMLGSVPVTGEKMVNAPGGNGIEPVGGYERDVQWLVARSDAMMNRTPLDWLDMDTGQPIPNINQSLNGARGWAKSTQIAEVCDPYSATNPYDDRRVPKKYNAGTCSYYPDILGLDVYNSYCIQDWQHGVRYLTPVLAAALCGDPCAIFDLGVIANDARLCRPAPLGILPGMGHGWYGTREAAWVIAALLSVPSTRALGLAHLDTLEKCQMPNGGFMAVSASAPFSPPPGFDKSYDVEQTMERWLTCHILALEGRTEAVRKSLAGIFDNPSTKSLGYVPKFVVTRKNGIVQPAIKEYSEHPDFFPWVALGAYAALAPSDPSWRRWMKQIALPSQGKATSDADLLFRMRKEVSGHSQVVAALSVLENTSV